MIDLAETSKNAILNAAGSFIDSKVQLSMVLFQRLIEIKYGVGKTGDLDVSTLEESRWAGYLAYFSQCTRIPELTIEVEDRTLTQ